MTQTDHARAGSLTRFLYEMREGGRRQANVIFALIYRELKSRSGSGSGGLMSFVGIIAEPALAVLILATFWYVIRRQEIQGVHVFLFLAVSYVPFMIFRRSITSIPRAMGSNRSFYAYQSIKPIDTIIARSVIELTLTLVGGVGFLFLIWWFAGMEINTDHLLEAIGMFFLLLLGAFGTALLVGTYGTQFPAIFKALQLCGRGLLFISCVLHPASELPAEAQTAIAWNPLAHFEEIFRSYIIGTQPFQAASFAYFAYFVLIVLFLGLVGYYANRFKVIER